LLVLALIGGVGVAGERPESKLTVTGTCTYPVVVATGASQRFL
jgi:hypothetical protein